MTQALYPTDSYLQSFSASVTGVFPEEHAITLDQTTFFPGGGGQPCDLGQLTGFGAIYPVVKVKKINGEHWHFLEPESPLPEVGKVLQGQIDWTRRYQLMRTHTALHVLCGVVFRDYGALVTGGDMDPLQGRMDFEFERMQKELVQDIERAVNQEIAQARPVQVRILPREEAFQIPDLIRTKINLLPEGITEIRTVEIVGLDLQADGGTHVANIAEVGQVHVVDYKSKGKINKRLYIALD